MAGRARRGKLWTEWGFQAELHGVSQAVQSLDSFKQGVRSRILRRAITRAVQPLAKDVKRRAPVRTRRLRQSIGYKVRVYRRTGTVFAAIGPRSGFKAVVDGKTVNPTKYAHLVEGGRKAVTAKQARFLSDGKQVFGRTARAAAPRRFISLAWKAGKGHAAATVRDEIARGILAEAERARNKRAGGA